MYHFLDLYYTYIYLDVYIYIVSYLDPAFPSGPCPVSGYLKYGLALATLVAWGSVVGLQGSSGEQEMAVPSRCGK